MKLESAKLGNVKVQKSFSEANKARHLQLHLPRPRNSQVGNNKETEHQQLRRHTRGLKIIDLGNALSGNGSC